MNKIHKLLSIDGGGVKGVLVLQFLIHLEEYLGCKISEYFDGFTGTSTGALIIILLASGKWTAREILENVYNFENITKIFSRGYIDWILGGAQYSCKYSDLDKIAFIKKYIKSEFCTDCDSNITLYDIKQPILIPSYNAISREPLLFRNYFNCPKYELEELCNATTAAPSYFPMAKVYCPNTCIHENLDTKIHEKTGENVSEKTSENVNENKNTNTRENNTNTCENTDTNIHENTDTNIHENTDTNIHENTDTNIHENTDTNIHENINTNKNPESESNLNNSTNGHTIWAIDGGIFANNPCELFYLDYLQLYPGEMVKILSIGTGIAKSTITLNTPSNIGGFGWLVRDDIIGLLMDSDQVATHKKMKVLSKLYNHSYIRVNDYLKYCSIELDNITQSNYQAMIKEGTEWWNNYREQIVKIF